MKWFFNFFDIKLSFNGGDFFSSLQAAVLQMGVKNFCSIYLSYCHRWHLLVLNNDCYLQFNFSITTSSIQKPHEK